jgi:hypothetical protein
MKRGLRLALAAAVAAACGGGSPTTSGGGPGPAPDSGGADDSGVTPDASGGGQDAAAQDVTSEPDDSPPRGTVDPQGKGGTVNRLAFTAFGDIRPALPDEDFAYPNTTVQAIVANMAAMHPEFAVATGDYMFVEYLPSSASAQLNSLLSDEKPFGAPIFHTMGNHECQSFTDVNCPMLNESVNITTYLSMLLPWTPVPWFSFVVHTDFGDAKFVFIAVNAWTDTQATWLDQVMSAETKYTFVIRHHPTPDAGMPSSAVGIAASDAILGKYPVTLYLFGHVHEYTHLSANRVVTGNAGAPLDAGNYGFLYVLQRPDGNIAVSEYPPNMNTATDTWAVTPDGAETP